MWLLMTDGGIKILEGVLIGSLIGRNKGNGLEEN